MPQTKHSPFFSVIIPLESHRGIAEDCVRAWANRQNFPRDSYQIVLASPKRARFGELERLLGPDDLLVQHPEAHDMSLAARAVEAATGEFLFFTEAHCIPDANALLRASEFLTAHPELSGFSGRSIPQTHNLLSEIEADMYSRDIERNLQTHEWLKVLDQCFVVKASALRSAGGIEPEIGHFAEWVLAARFYEKGLKIGVAPEVIVHHRYSGSIQPLVEFTHDFAHGELLFAARGLADSCTRLFPKIWRFEIRHRGDARILRKELSILLRRFFREPLAFGGDEGMSELVAWRVGMLMRILSERFLLDMRFHIAKFRTRFWLKLNEREFARNAFLTLIVRTVALGYEDALREISPNRGADRLPKAGKWLCGWPDPIMLSGFHIVEVWRNKIFQWSHPMASAAFRLGTGAYCLKIRWYPIRPAPKKEELRIFLNGIAVEPGSLKVNPECLEVLVHLDRDGGALLTWICPAFPSEGDDRKLGLPVYEIEWSPVANTQSWEAPASDEGDPETVDPALPGGQSIYFLHVTKCAGTNLSIILENSFSSDEIAAPFLEHYYRRETDRLSIPNDCRFVRGHFGWRFLENRTECNWKVITMLRNPLERLGSLYRFQLMLGRIEAGTSFEEWIRRHLTVDNTMTSFFIGGIREFPDADSVAGMEAVSNFLARHAPQALRNLQKCDFVCLQGRLEESIDLLSEHLHVLPPPYTERAVEVNRTTVEMRGLEISSRLQDDIEALLEPERQLYETAEELFETRFEELKRTLANRAGRDLDDCERRDYLRSQTLAEKAGEIILSSHSLEWRAEDEYWGTNLGRREMDGGICHRWSGPEESTLFLLPLPVKRSGRWTVQLELHPATPHPHLDSLQLVVEGHPVEFQAPVPDEDSFKLEGRLDFAATTVGASGHPFASFVMTTPVKQGDNEFRMLGVALRSIKIESCEKTIQ